MFMEGHDKLSENEQRGALGWMMRLASTENESALEVLSKMAKKYKIDIFSVDEDKRETVSLEKLQGQ